MAFYKFDRARSQVECAAAKSKLKDFYRWKYGHAPPQDWTVDHQVEQAPDYYERFGPTRIHDPLNMLMVPREVNVAKNIAFGQRWSLVSEAVRALAPDFAPDLSSFSSEPSVRELAYDRSELLDDEDAWHFLTDLSQTVLAQVIAELEATWWKEKTPGWMEQYPRWLARLKLEVTHHLEHYLEFERYCVRRGIAR